MNKTGVQLYSFDDSIFNFMFRVSKKKILYYIRHSAMMMGKELFPESIIKNLSITFYSFYYIITPKHRFHQPRRILESKLLRHITNLKDFEKKITMAFYRLCMVLWIMMIMSYMRTKMMDNHICYLING